MALDKKPLAANFFSYKKYFCDLPFNYDGIFDFGYCACCCCFFSLARFLYIYISLFSSCHPSFAMHFYVFRFRIEISLSLSEIKEQFFPVLPPTHTTHTHTHTPPFLSTELPLPVALEELGRTITLQPSSVPFSSSSSSFLRDLPLDYPRQAHSQSRVYANVIHLLTIAGKSLRLA